MVPESLHPIRRCQGRCVVGGGMHSPPSLQLWWLTALKHPPSTTPDASASPSVGASFNCCPVSSARSSSLVKSRPNSPRDAPGLPVATLTADPTCVWSLDDRPSRISTFRTAASFDTLPPLDLACSPPLPDIRSPSVRLLCSRPSQHSTLGTYGVLYPDTTPLRFGHSAPGCLPHNNKLPTPLESLFGRSPAFMILRCPAREADCQNVERK